jgi:hypothetical protein
MEFSLSKHYCKHKQPKSKYYINENFILYHQNVLYYISNLCVYIFYHLLEIWNVKEDDTLKNLVSRNGTGNCKCLNSPFH